MAEPVPLLDYEQLRNAVCGTDKSPAAAAIRLRAKLQPAGGRGTKVFPPTYAGGVYATEKRRIGERVVECVLLDSVQSQANRLEQALLQAYRDGKLSFPLLSVEFPADLPDIGSVTTLDAPHRIFDAILRDSEVAVNGQDMPTPFRSQLKAEGKKDTSKISAEGEAISKANVRNATPLFELCPTALIFGAWDSTGAAGGLGNKFARALVSEIVGVGAVYGVRTASRIDPLGITGGKIFEDVNGDWTPNDDNNTKKVKVKRDKEEVEEPVPFARKKSSDDAGKPSEINHSNVTPDIVRYAKADSNTPDILRGREVNINYSVSTEEGQVAQRGLFRTGDTSIREKFPRPGGATVEYAEQTTVLSLAALRRLRFPAPQTTSTDNNPEQVKQDGPEGINEASAEAKPIEIDLEKAKQERKLRAEVDFEARTVLAALALAAVAHQIDPPDYFLRSNCQLVLKSDPVFKIVFSASRTEKFTLTAPQADAIFEKAVRAWKAAWKAAYAPMEPDDAVKYPWREAG
ncbi:MAG: type I-U CRISPR-associated RAMP protein Csb1/Cas7u, partial [Gemmataceae bacterium]